METFKFDVFLSYATPDKPVVEDLARRLKKAGFEPWLDKWNLIPGEPWQEAIEKALEDCAACAVCLGPSGTGPWQNEEMRAAIDARVTDRSRAFRVIPVLLPHSERGEPSRLPAFLRATTWVEFRDTLDDENALHRLIRGIQGVPPGPDPGKAVAEGAQPYRGLQVFDVGDALFFFGREALTEWLLDKLRTDRNRFLAIVGPSGSGKSSLARAGLVAALKRGEIPGSDAWPAAIFKPGAQPLESLAISLSSAARLGDSPSAVRELIRDLGADPRMLHLTTRFALRDAPAGRRLVVLVDQFEEIFTLCPDETQRQAIIANLLHAATVADGQTVIVLTLRADFYGRCAGYPDLATAVSDRQSLVGPMTRDELRSAIERPAYLAGCELEGGLTDLLLNEVESQPGSLPLLEHALLQIWQRREGGRRLTIEAYREIGGVAGALEKHAEEVYSGFTEEEKEACRLIFLRLVQVDEQGRATKRRLGLEELPGAGVIARLTDARLLTTDQEKQPTVELAHEALLANWERLKQWIDQDREALRTRRRLDEAVTEWIGKDRDSSFLLEGGRLAQAEEWAGGNEGEMGQEAKDFLAASVAERDRERQRELDQAKALEEEQRRRADAEHQRAEEQGQARRRLKRWAVASGITATIALLSAATALYLRQTAKQQESLVTSGELSDRSRSITASNPQLGALLAAEALKMARSGGEPFSPRAQSALRWSLTKSGGLPLPSGRIRLGLMTPDRRLLVTMGEDRHLRVWNLDDQSPTTSGADLGELPPDVLPHVAASPNPTKLLVAGEKGARLIDIRDPRVALNSATFLNGEDWLLADKPFSPDGAWLATRRDRDYLLRDLRRPGIGPVNIIHERPINASAFNSNSIELATASGNLIELWDLHSPIHAVVAARLPTGAKVMRLHYRDDSTLVVTSEDSTKTSTWMIHKIIPGKPLPLCLAGESFIQRMVINPEFCLTTLDSDSEQHKDNDLPLDTFIADTSPNGDWRVLMNTGNNVHYLERTSESNGHVSMEIPASSVGFARSKWLVTSNDPEAPRLWDLSRGPDVADSEPRIFRDSTFRLLIANRGRLQWDSTTGQLSLSGLSKSALAHRLPGSEGSISPYAASPDGQWFAASRRNQSILLWNIRPDGTVRPPSSISVGMDLETLAISSSGHWLAAIDSRGGNFLWNLLDPHAPPFRLTNLSGAGLVAFSPNDEFIVSSGWRGELYFRALGQARPSLADSAGFRAPSFIPNSLAFSPDSQWLALGGRIDRIQIRNTQGNDVYVESRSAKVDSLAFSPDGEWLAAGGSDGMVQLWRWAGERTFPLPIILEGHTGQVSSVQFMPEGLATAALDHTVRLWELRSDQLIKRACRSAGRTLRRWEWNSYILSPYQAKEPCPEFPKPYD